MTPLGQGPRGYADWQRVVNWDGPFVLNAAGGVIKGKLASPIVETSRYGYLAGRIRIFLAPVTMELVWYADAAGVEVVGQRQMVLDPGIVRGTNLRIPNLGPFVAVTFRPATEATEWENVILLFLTNRIHPLELIPELPLLLNEEHVFAGAENLTIYPNSYYAGPVHVLVNKGAVAGEVYLEAATVPGVWVRIDQRVIEAAKTVESFNITVPAGAWRLTLSSGGAQAFNVRVTPSLTGST